VQPFPAIVDVAADGPPSPSGAMLPAALVLRLACDELAPLPETTVVDAGVLLLTLDALSLLALLVTEPVQAGLSEEDGVEPALCALPQPAPATPTTSASPAKQKLRA
jgi:hypothetical protein